MDTYICLVNECGSSRLKRSTHLGIGLSLCNALRREMTQFIALLFKAELNK